VGGARYEKTHFEQVRERAVKAMQNSVRVFDFANKQSELLRRNQDKLDSFRNNVIDRETDFKNRLIETFGYPYADDIGPTGTYPAGYDGPDLYHYMYVDKSELTGEAPAPVTEFTGYYRPMEYIGYYPGDVTDRSQAKFKEVTYHQSTDNYWLVKPDSWKGKRRASGKIQSALSNLLQTHNRLERGIQQYENHIRKIKDAGDMLQAQHQLKLDEIKLIYEREKFRRGANSIIRLMDQLDNGFTKAKKITGYTFEATKEAVPKNVLVGMSSGGDLLAAVRSGMTFGANFTKGSLDFSKIVVQSVKTGAVIAKEVSEGLTEFKLKTLRADFAIKQRVKTLEQLVRQEAPLRLELYNLQEANQQSIGKYLSTLAEGERLLQKLVRFRKLTAAKVQEHRYQDMAFRIFRNDALQKYRAQFDLAARYVYLAATAYDYETNLLGTEQGAGRKFLTDIVRQRSLGQMLGGLPMAGSRGLADPLARMGQNFEVYKGQMGFNNPQSETNPFSLRSQLFRLNGSSDVLWRAELERHRVADLWTVPEFRRHCRPFAPEESGTQPGLVIPFSTNITFGLNYFGWPLSGGDSAYDPTNFATKVRSVGVWFDEYNGSGLSQTPRIYLVPAGADVLRSPTGDTFATREWQVVDQALPIPFPIGPANLVDPEWIPINDSLNEEMVAIRRMSSFRAYHDDGLDDAQMIQDSRLIGRSVWNTKWMLIIPGGTLLSDANEGLNTFIHGQDVSGVRDGNGIEDIKIYFKTYAYSGN
jgi:hypothetical protein